MATESRVRYLFRRERADGKANETTALTVFEGWLRKAEHDDHFYVARCDWVECEKGETIPWGKSDLPTVTYVEHVDAVENWGSTKSNGTRGKRRTGAAKETPTNRRSASMNPTNRGSVGA